MIAIRCSALFDGTSLLTGGATVVMDGASIVGVEAGHPDVAADVEVVEFGDATLLPGLIDTHVHLVTDSGPTALDLVEGYTDAEVDAVVTRSLAAHLAAGVTTVRDLGDRRFVVVDRRDAQRSASSVAAAPVQPTILASGPPLTSPRGHCYYLGGEVSGPVEIEAAVRERIDRGVDIVKVMASGGMATTGTDVMLPQFSLEELRLIVEIAHAAGIPVTAHAHALAAVEISLAARVDGLEHCSCLTPQGVRIPAEVLAALVERQIPVGAALMAPPPFSYEHAPPNIKKMLTQLGVTPEQWLELRRDAAGRAHAAGVRFVGGSDAGINPFMAHGLMRSGLEFLVSAGASVSEALAAGTSRAASACGLERKGSVGKGFDADLLVVDGEFGADLGPLERVRQVMLGGRWVR
ncbi:MAG TPA: amidohydrolase family protein [Nakamurella sp.]|jgi:imidazolonepropionase-like amidohydrolase